MKRMIEMICCDICGEPLDICPDYLKIYPFKAEDGNKSEIFICDNCLESETVECYKCHCRLRIEDAFSFDKAGRFEDYCEQCVGQAIEDKLQDIEEVKKKLKLKNARKVFECRKVKRE